MKTVTVEPIKVKRLSEMIESHITDLILKGEIPPGERLPTEKEIGEQFGVSLVTVREALKGLEVSGFIEKKKGKGGGVFAIEPKSEFVKHSLFTFLSTQHFSSEHLTELRLMLEPATARMAAQKIEPPEIRMLEENVRYCEDNIREISTSERKQKNIEFHRLIAEATKNPVLALTIDYVMDFLFNFKIKNLVYSPDFALSTIQGHWDILAMLRVNDGDGAEKAMVLHLKKVEDFFSENEGKG